MVLMECKLCKKDFANLENSHVIPEWIYKPLYNEKHKFIEINSNNFKKLKPEQKGYREKLLCKCCEAKFSKWETNAKKDLEDITNKKSKFLEITQLSNKFLFVENISYDYLKKFILSILWRMSVTSLEQFKGIKLGVFEENLRGLLDADMEIDTFTYPIMVRQLQVSGKHYKDVIMGVEKGRIQNKYIFQSFVAYGYMFDVVVSKLRFPSNFSELLLNQNGRMPVELTDVMSLPHDERLLNRLNDSDVLKFHNKI